MIVKGNKKGRRHIKFPYKAVLSVVSSALLLVLLRLEYKHASSRSNEHRLIAASPTQHFMRESHVKNQIQKSHVTGINRYPDEYSFVKEYVDSHWSDQSSSVKLLSFGSSTGEEAISLATLYFNSTRYKNIKIYGTDIDQPTIEKAVSNVGQITSHLHPNITFFNGQEVDLSLYGDYDVIFANSVLCFYDKPIEQVLKHFTYGQFVATLRSLDDSLKVGGLLAMVNFNYNIEDTEFAKTYTPIGKCGGNFVPRVDRRSSTFVSTKGDILDCVWVKNQRSDIL